MTTTTTPTMKGTNMSEITTSELAHIEGGARCEGVYIQIGDFGLCIGSMGR
jgi:bacteriocin-like protein